ncbi:MAG: zf-HC2 domain-containing protein [Actinomycetota bacterium]
MTSSADNPLEAALGRAGERPRFLAGPDASGPGPDLHRVSANFAAIEAEIDAPRPSRLARLLRRVGVPDTTVPLVTATPALRRSWIIAVLIAILFALNTASTSTADGADRIIGFLTVAPLIPLLGVALAFGPGVDPTHDVAVATPVDGFRLFLVRAITVVSASCAVLLLVAWVVPEGGWYRIAWLLPALAVTATSLALATRFDARVAAGITAAAWLTLMLVLTNRADAATAFGAATQLTSLAVAVVGYVLFVHYRQRLDTLSLD